MWAALGSRKISVEPHQIITTSVEVVLIAEPVDVLAEPSSVPRLLAVGFTFGPSSRFTYRGSNAAFIGRTCAQRLGDGLEVPTGVKDAGTLGRDVRIVGERIPTAEHEIVELRERHELLDQRHVVIGALAEPDGAHLRERPDGLRHPPLGELDPRDERARDGAHADRRARRGALRRVSPREAGRSAISGRHEGSVRGVRTRCCTTAPVTSGRAASARVHRTGLVLVGLAGSPRASPERYRRGTRRREPTPRA